MVRCPSSHQPTKIREETLESGGPLQRKLNFRLRTHGILYIENIREGSNFAVLGGNHLTMQYTWLLHLVYQSLYHKNYDFFQIISALSFVE